MILFDQGFEVSTGLYSMGLQTGFHTITFSRQVAFKCWTRRRVKEWVDALKDTASTTGTFATIIQFIRKKGVSRLPRVVLKIFPQETIVTLEAWV